MNFKALSLSVLATSVFAGPALAHHSYSMFDIDKDVTLKGTVKSLEWTNPHCWLTVMAEGPATHKIEQWSIELASTGQQTHVGWSATVVKPGDQVTVDIMPLKDGTRGGSIISILLPNGTKLGHGHPPTRN